jgi:hypothetical protein
VQAARDILANDNAARRVVRAAADTLCPAASADGLADTAPSSAAPAPKTATPEPLAVVPPGTYEVGTGAGQVAPRRYRSPGPAGGGSCYFARLRDASGESDDIIANDSSDGPSILTVKESDAFVEVSGCTFTKA